MRMTWALAATAVWVLVAVAVSPGLAHSASVTLGCPASAQSGTTFVAEVKADVGTTPLGAYTINLTYVATEVTIASVQGGTTTEFSAAPISNPASFRSGMSRFAAFNTTSLDTPTGMVSVARVTFNAIGGSPAAIGLQIVTLADTSGTAIAATSGGCSVDVAAGTTTSTMTSTTTSTSSSTMPSSTTTTTPTTSTSTSTTSTTTTTTTTTTSSSTAPTTSSTTTSTTITTSTSTSSTSTSTTSSSSTTSTSTSVTTTSRPTTTTVPSESNCTDGIDNDGDGLIDCADPDCATDPSCCSSLPTFGSTGCRLGMLLADVNTAPGLGALRAGLAQQLKRAIDARAMADDLCQAGSLRRANIALRRALRWLTSFESRVKSLDGRRTIPSPTAAMLLTAADPLRRDLLTLREGLVCPPASAGGGG